MSAAVRVSQFASSPCGGVRAGVAGVEALLRPSGALWIEAEGMLVAADLHLEKGSAFAARGQLLPPYDTGETLRRLAAEAEALSARAVVLLGDTLHDGGAEARMAAKDEAKVAAIARGRILIWVVGNHDADGPRRLPGEVADELSVGSMILRHEPLAGPSSGEAAGHLHPSARVSARGRSVRRRCFVTDGRRVILPAFGAYAGGLNVRDQAFAGLFAGAPVVVALGSGRAHAVPWTAVSGE
ncbi:ligase-associated DNA damage response endonuclease PdeM [Phenylobacterium montanum]|uniref:Ligase-associated DNA damage response endonuclease PdeM n=1 Tax=Phenylobacterium montanum TaxID=2823693 RepID=A0A975FYZ6_9CAUL|nr:ligase-associated DNA damage response endonuclease PdeM [Caulobacter sp. S6]QUD86906.1 ligase-associated DNA damage response endonuclease PdeM [Caulobacter sp. S6]